MKSISLTSFLGASGFLLLTACPVSADSTENFSHTTVSGQTSFTDTFTIPAFDTSQGTLVAIDLAVQENTTADVIVFNTTTNSQPFTNAHASVPTTIKGPDGLSFTVTDVASLASGTAVVGGNDFPGVQSTLNDSIQIDPSQFASWETGQGQTVTLSFAVTDGTFSGVATPGVFFGGTAIVGGSTTVTYTFKTNDQSVPEPSTWALMLGGLGVLAFWRMRRALR